MSTEHSQRTSDPPSLIDVGMCFNGATHGPYVSVLFCDLLITSPACRCVFASRKICQTIGFSMFMRKMKLSTGFKFTASVCCWIFSVACALVLMGCSAVDAQDAAVCLLYTSDAADE